jgi:hypothetical protein
MLLNCDAVVRRRLEKGSRASERARAQDSALPYFRDLAAPCATFSGEGPPAVARGSWGAFDLCCSDGKRRRSEARDLSRLSPGTSEATAPLCLFAGEAEKQRKRKASLAERKERFRREARTDESVRILCAALIGAPFRYLQHSARATSLDTERSRTGSKSRTCVRSDTPPRASIPLSRPRRS